MKKTLLLAAILTISGASVFTSCSSNDDDNTGAVLDYTVTTPGALPCWR